jgi:hypothetical protein
MFEKILIEKTDILSNELIDIEKLADGAYYVKISSDKKNRLIRFIKG